MTQQLPVNGFEWVKKLSKFDESIYLGMSILDISKTLMYEFCYYYIKAKY